MPAHGVRAQSTPIVKLSCNAANYPSCGGWTAKPENAFYTRRLVTGAGPTGQDVVQFDLTPSGTHSQFYLGWGTSVPAAPQGSTRYLRVRIRFLSPLNLTGNQPEGAWTNKFVILGDGSDSSSRVIAELRPMTSASSISSRIQRNIDGDPNRTAAVAMSIGPWHSLQWEVRSSSASGVPDARLRFWQDSQNVTYTSPTSQSGTFSLSTAQWNNLNLGYYSNASLATTGRLSFQISDFEYDDQFDPNWHQGGAAVPSAPANLRIVGASVSGPLALLVLGLLVRRRERP